MTLIVASAMGETPDALYDAGRKAEASAADWIEIRLDGPSGLPWDLRPYFSYAKPCIATVRHTMDGGRSGADDKTRADILRRAVLAGAKAIDVETWSDEASTLAKEAHAHGALVIASAHLADTPHEDVILQHLRDARALGADHAKLATRVATPADAAALVRAAQRARDEGIPYALMAVNDPFLRLLAPALGMSLVYASVPGEAPATSGQVPVDLLRPVHAHGAPADVTGATRPVFLLGRPVAHSKSPAMHNAAFRALGIDARYLALDVAPVGLAPTLAGLRASSAMGCNLTIPHKEAAVALMDELDASAREAGAVNTVVFRGARAIGHNTDGAGALAALDAASVPYAESVLLVGAGGTGRAIAAALKAAGARFAVTNRTPERAQSVAQAAGATALAWDEAMRTLDAYRLVVHATSIGLLEDAAPFDVAALRPDATILDCVYRRGGTRLARAARARGLRVVAGEEMLLHQGARSFALWTGQPAPLAAMRAALEAA